MVGCLGRLWSIVWLAAIGASAVAAQSDQYGVVFGTGYNATTQYFNKNSSVTYTDESCTDFFTIVLGLAAQNSTGPTGSISYQDLESGVVLAKSELTPQGTIFTGGPSYSIANVAKLKTWRLPQTFSKVVAVYHSSRRDITASSADNFNISFAGQTATVLSTFAQVTVSLGLPTFGGCSGVSLASQIEADFAGLDPFYKNFTALSTPIAAAPAPSTRQAVNVSRVVVTAVLTKYNVTAFNQDLQNLYLQTIANITGVQQVHILSLRSGSVLIDTEVFVDDAALSSFASDLTSGSSATFPPDGPMGPVSLLDPAGGSAAGCPVNVRLRVFIPTPIVYATDPLGLVKILAFNGNDRTFCYDCGTSKADIQTTFTVTSSDLSDLGNAGPGTGAFDTTMRYDKSDTQPLPGGPFWAGQLISPNAAPIASKQLQRTTSNLYIQPTSENQLTIHIDGSDPFFALGEVSFAPAINVDIVVTFNIDSDGYIEYAVSGNHDSFPSYELYINQQLVYSWDAIAEGTSPFNLLPPVQPPLTPALGLVPVSVPPTILFDSIAGCHKTTMPPPPPPTLSPPMTPINQCSEALQALQNTCASSISFPATAGTTPAEAAASIYGAQSGAIAAGDFQIISASGGSVSDPSLMQEIETTIAPVVTSLGDSCNIVPDSPVLFSQPCQPQEEGCDGSGVDGCSG